MSNRHTAAPPAPHTPGPWTIERYGRGGFASVVGPTRKGGTAPLTDLLRDKAELDANARLIAAAPEMLAQIHDFLTAAEKVPVLATPPYDVNVVYDALPFMKALDAARALLARIEGKEPTP